MVTRPVMASRASAIRLNWRIVVIVISGCRQSKSAIMSGIGFCRSSVAGVCKIPNGTTKASFVPPQFWRRYCLKQHDNDLLCGGALRRKRNRRAERAWNTEWYGRTGHRTYRGSGYEWSAPLPVCSSIRHNQFFIIGTLVLSRSSTTSMFVPRHRKSGTATLAGAGGAEPRRPCILAEGDL